MSIDKDRVIEIAKLSGAEIRKTGTASAPNHYITFSDKTIVAFAQALQANGQEAVGDNARIPLVIALHDLASNFENSLYLFGDDVEARRKANGDIAYAMQVAARYNYNGRKEPSNEVARLQARIARLEKENTEYFQAAKKLTDYVVRLRERVELLEDVLNKVASWCKAYPITIFTEPNWDEVKDKLGANLLCAVSASNMRHITEGIQKLIDPSLGETNPNAPREALNTGKVK